MDFFMKIFSRGHKKNMASSNSEENCDITGKTSFEQCYPEVDNSNNLETESTTEIKDNESTKDSSVISIHELGFTKTFHNLASVPPIEITNDNIDRESNLSEVNLSEDALFENTKILNFPAEVNSVNDDRHDATTSQSDNNIIQTEVSYEVPNDPFNTGPDTNNVIDDVTMQNLREFDEVFVSMDENALYDDLGSDTINLDDIFDELDDDDVPLSLLKSFSVLENNDSATLTKMTAAKEHSNINENLDIIPINSSNEDANYKTEALKDTNSNSDESDTEDGYNSSDFEFISETEAKMTGIIINFDVDKYRNLSQASSEPIIDFDEDQGLENEMPGPITGPSRQNEPRNEFEDRSYRNNHQIPEGDEFLGLFQGIYNPLLPMSEIFFLENKSVRTSAMNSQYDGMGFDKQLALRRYQPDSSEDEFDEDARESAKKILNMYPGQNRKRRRRYLRKF